MQRRLLLKFLVVGKSCFLAPNLSASPLMWWRKEAWLFDRQWGWPVTCHMARNWGRRRWTLLVSEDTMGRFYTAAERWFSVLDQLESGLVLRLAGGIQKAGRRAAWARDLIKRRNEPGAGVYVCRSKSLTSPELPVFSPLLHSLMKWICSLISALNLFKKGRGLESKSPV